MPSTKLDIKGTLEWAKVFETNRDRATWNEETEGEYKVTITTDKKTADLLKKEGCMKTMSDVEDGVKITFSRPHKGKQEWMGGAPVVADVSGKAWSLDSKGFIGNGSKGIVKVEVYPTNTGRKGTRLLGLQVLEHVVYESDGESSSSSSMFQDHSQSSSGNSSSSSQESQDSIPF
tara:strand:- start:277 stop:801 length:525 start_codon:yes stop_codon:yes gene_type:complete